MKIGFTGTRKGMSNRQKESLEILLVGFYYTPYTGAFLHHGDCVGSDAEAHEIAFMMGFDIIIHPPIYSEYRAFCENAFKVMDPLGYLARNKVIVDSSEILIATPENMVEELKSGTWATIRYARRIGKPVIILDN